MAVVRDTPLPRPGPPGELLIAPTGRWMVVLVRGADLCQVFEITAIAPVRSVVFDPETGALGGADVVATLPGAAGLAFAPA